MKNSTVRTQAEKKYAHLPADDNLPLAIGANFHDDPISRDTLRKSHNLLLSRKTDYAPHTEYTYTGGTVRAGQNGTGQFYASATGGRSAAADGGDENIWEGWFTEEISEEDKKEFVVRMVGYFTEAVPESPTETERVRKVCIKYFVKDDSISVVEAKEDNSGMVQSTILSRRRVPKVLSNTSELILLEDFHVGEPVTIYGITYMITDMDKRSRRYFSEVRGTDIPPGIAAPEDAFSVSKTAQLQSTHRAITSDDMDRKRVAEQQLTGIYTKHSNEDITIARQFLKNKINEHLTYYALWDDRGNLSGDVHLCMFRVYLENLSIEVVEMKPENSGRDGGPVLISRQRIPKPDADLTQSRYQQHTYGPLMKNNYLTPDDLQIGETYKVYGKPFYIFDADTMTRDYVKENFGMELHPALDIAPFISTDKKPVFFQVPPPNGLGSEKEQRDSWLPLIGKPARINLEKVRAESGRIMNFSTHLVKPLAKGDERRRFVVTFYRESSEVEINERVERNSGFLGGRFLAKGKHRKTLPNGVTRLFEPADFVVGKEVVIFDRPFFLDEMDEGTKRIMEGTDRPTTEDKVKGLVVLLRQQVNLRFKRANEAYLAIAPQGTMGYKQLQEFLRSCSCDATDEEALLLVQNISPGTNGVISFEDFLAILSVTAETMDGAHLSVRSIKNVNMNVDATMKDTAKTSETKQRRRKLQDLLQQKLIQRKGTTMEQFRLLSEHSTNSRLNRDVFRRSLNEVMHFNMSKEDEDTMVSMLFDGAEDENGDITFKQFQEFVDTCQLR